MFNFTAGEELNRWYFTNHKGVLVRLCHKDDEFYYGSAACIRGGDVNSYRFICDRTGSSNSLQNGLYAAVYIEDAVNADNIDYNATQIISAHVESCNAMAKRLQLIEEVTRGSFEFNGYSVISVATEYSEDLKLMVDADGIMSIVYLNPNFKAGMETLDRLKWASIRKITQMTKSSETTEPANTPKGYLKRTIPSGKLVFVAPNGDVYEIENANEFEEI